MGSDRFCCDGLRLRQQRLIRHLRRKATLTTAFDWNQIAGVISKAGTNAEDQWVARSQHSQGGRAFRFGSDDGRVAPLAARL